MSVSRHFLLQARQCPCSVRKRFSRDHCCRGRSKPGCRIFRSEPIVPHYPSPNNVQAVYHCLQVSTDTYLTYLTGCSGCRCLRSAACKDLMLPRTKTITYGSRRFAVSGPRVWNDLPCNDCAFIIHQTWTVPEQTKDNTISLGLRDVT